MQHRSTGAVNPHGIKAQEFGDRVDLGMSPSAAVLASSQGSAKLLGIDGETGTLEAGKFADIVAVPGDVLQNNRATEKPVLVMKQGGCGAGRELTKRILRLIYQHRGSCRFREQPDRL